MPRKPVQSASAAPNKNQLRTFFLTESKSPLGKALENISEPWQREIVRIILAPDLSSKSKTERIRDQLSKLEDADPEDDQMDGLNALVELLPTRARGKARVLVRFWPSNLKLKEGLVLFPDGQVGSPALDVLKYYSTPQTYRVPLPLALWQMNQVMRDSKVPAAAFDQSKSPYTFSVPPKRSILQDDVKTRKSWLVLD